MQRQRRRVGLGEAVAKGALAGVVGGVAMLVTRELELRGLFPGERRPEPAIRREGRPRRRRQRLDAPRPTAGIGAQLAAAAAVGVLYGVVQSRLRLPPTATGALLGGLVYAGNASGVLPGAGLLAPSPGRTLKEALVPAGTDAVFGLATARAFTLLTER